MNEQFLKSTLVWGFGLWFLGYILSFVLFFIVSPQYIGWIIMPLGILATIWVLVKKFTPQELSQYFVIGIVWIALAILLDYLFIVKALNPDDGYYKPSVFIYYVLTILIPGVYGFYKRKVQS